MRSLLILGFALLCVGCGDSKTTVTAPEKFSPPTQEASAGAGGGATTGGAASGGPEEAKLVP